MTISTNKECLEMINLTAEEIEAQEPMLQFFAYQHLPINLQLISKPFCELAYRLVHSLTRNPERTVALRKLLESKDCAIRAAIYKI